MATFYVVTDVEFDGPRPGINSMLSFASVAVSESGKQFSAFEAVLEPLEEAMQDDETMAFWQLHPAAWAASTRDPEPPETVMHRFVGWVRSFQGEPIFAAHPVALDGPWLDYYLKRYTGRALFEGPWREDRLFRHAPLCLMSLVAGKTGRRFAECDVNDYPSEWLGAIEHTHRPIDDARGYARLLCAMLA
ncbi:MAG: DNA polymerase III subunit epsilon [Phyllobacterium sp.]